MVIFYTYLITSKNNGLFYSAEKMRLIKFVALSKAYSVSSLVKLGGLRPLNKGSYGVFAQRALFAPAFGEVKFKFRCLP